MTAKRTLLLLAVVAVATVFLFFLYQVQAAPPQFDWIAQMQNQRAAGSIGGWQLLTNWVTLVSLGIPFGVLVVGEWKWRTRWTRHFFLFTGLSVGLAGLVNYLIKISARCLRPFEADTRILQLSSGGSFSFPSGHTAEAFAAAVMMSLLWPRWYVVLPALLWACAIAFSRVYLGVHSPADVTAGMIVGSSVSYIFYSLSPKNPTFAKV
ncbi:MAG: phosphatase PAP2 family protein [Cyclobacteriaceae bacterium]|jgi:membrane-associated phospholipid phosphatase|nr:phosphatase PAP2 family protein [Flammeovirgaceae bacterium]